MNIQNERVQILLKIRPFLQQEDQTQIIQILEDNQIRINQPGQNIQMKFDDIIGNDFRLNDQNQIIKQQLDQFLQGQNISIFTYGQTGAGKTYTIFGDSLNEYSFKNEGILPQSMDYIFNKLSFQQYKLFISYYEIYNDQIYDLLNTETLPNDLEIRESNNKIHIKNLSSFDIVNFQQSIQILKQGNQNRKIGISHINNESSRSHSIYHITLKQNQKQQLLRFIDLAGSEKYKIPYYIKGKEREQITQELVSINTSLSTLGQCIQSLSNFNNTHLPVRNSKLTRTDSFFGNSKIIFIICISPSLMYINETLTTLQFASRAKKAIIRQNSKINDDFKNNNKNKNTQQDSKNINQQLVINLQQENKKLYERINILEKQCQSNNYSQNNENLHQNNQIINFYSKQNEISQQSYQTQINDQPLQPNILNESIQNVQSLRNSNFSFENCQLQLDDQIDTKNSQFQDTKVNNQINENIKLNQIQIKEKQEELNQLCLKFENFLTNNEQIIQ